MPLRPGLWAEIQAALGHIPSANLTTLSPGADLYEAYVWSQVLRAARREGAAITYKDRTGAMTTSFWFRTSPSSVYSNAHPYSHAELQFDGCPTLEAHIGIFVSGRSRVSHECDVAVIYKSEADICRARNVDPRSGKVVLTVECKHYVNANVGINLGRSFLGLLQDIWNGDRFFVATRRSDSVARLFAKHNKLYEMGVSPINLHLEARLRHSFELCFRDFVSSAS